ATAATGTSTTPNPPNLDPSAWGTEDTLWLAIVGWDDGTTGMDSIPTAYATPNGQTRVNFASDGCGVSMGTRELNATSEDPGTFLLDVVSEAWIAQTVAIRPAAAPLTIQLAGIASGQAFGSMSVLKKPKVQGNVKHFDGSNVASSGVQYTGSKSGFVLTDGAGNYSITLDEGDSITVYATKGDYISDQEPTGSQDHYDIVNITANQTGKDFKVRDKLDVLWEADNRTYAGRVPFTFPDTHGAYIAGQVMRAIAELGLHRRLHNRGVFQQAVQEMSQSVVEGDRRTHFCWIGHPDLGSTNLSVYTASLDHDTGSVLGPYEVVSGIGADTHFYAAMQLDREGYLILTSGWHDNNAGKFYRSNNKNDVSAFTLKKNFSGVTGGTYPHIAISTFDPGSQPAGRYFIFMRNATTGGLERDALIVMHSDDLGASWTTKQYLTYTEESLGINDPHAHYPFGFRQQGDVVMILWSLRHNYGN
ncbi:MAG: BNR repeat-containing protein, partial [Anaerolineae bacterium]|nr:BNR repeat-containing protein [Anaerolineae bacterium]